MTKSARQATVAHHGTTKRKYRRPALTVTHPFVHHSVAKDISNHHIATVCTRAARPPPLQPSSPVLGHVVTGNTPHRAPRRTAAIAKLAKSKTKALRQSTVAKHVRPAQSPRKRKMFALVVQKANTLISTVLALRAAPECLRKVRRPLTVRVAPPDFSSRRMSPRAVGARAALKVLCSPSQVCRSVTSVMMAITRLRKL